MKVGLLVICATCERPKSPKGRRIPGYIDERWCSTSQCPGYDEDPKPGDLWPAETEAMFGSPVGPNAVKELP